MNAKQIREARQFCPAKNGDGAKMRPVVDQLIIKLSQAMKTITIRDLCQRWPEAEAALQVEDEILITRDSKPVAKLVRIIQDTAGRKRWNPEEHAKWSKKVWGNRTVRSSDAALARARADRWEKESA
jgi:antitoxin (DNA-binding transcriptional repressor) of toxin-antitoxin stability system